MNIDKIELISFTFAFISVNNNLRAGSISIQFAQVSGTNEDKKKLYDDGETNFENIFSTSFFFLKNLLIFNNKKEIKK